MSLYAANGKINTTAVAGNTYTGRYAPDGSWNIVTNVSATYVGLIHPCGAYNAVTGTANTYYNANGSLNVVANASSPSGFSPALP